MSPTNDEDGERPSWREIDRRRDRSRHVTGEGRSFKEQTLRSDWAKKQHLKEAEKFFQGKKGSAAYKSAYNEVHENYGTPRFQEAAQNLLKEFGLPDDWGTLLLLLDYSDPKWVTDALAALKKLYESRSLIEQRGFKGKLKVLALTAKDPGLREMLESVLAQL